jgi:hypothetical protein
VSDPGPSPARFDERPKSAQALFAFRLRLYRERKRISLREIAAVTRIRLERLEGLERGDLTHWPRGLYARAWVRAYAAMVGLDPVDTLDEFCRLFPHGDRRARETMRDIAAIVAHPSEYRDEVRDVDRRGRGTPHAAPAPEPALRAALRQLQWVLGFESR